MKSLLKDCDLHTLYRYQLGGLCYLARGPSRQARGPSVAARQAGGPSAAARQARGLSAAARQARVPSDAAR